jgi:phosphatidylserine decarboxylase
VVEARDLMSMDYSGKSDPYVVLTFGSEKFTTRCIKQDLNPVWNEVHNFDVKNGREELKVEVYDKDEFGSDDYLGGYLIPNLEEYKDQTPKDKWINLFPENPSQTQWSGRLRIII